MVEPARLPQEPTASASDVRELLHSLYGKDGRTGDIPRILSSLDEIGANVKDQGDRIIILEQAAKFVAQKAELKAVEERLTASAHESRLRITRLEVIIALITTSGTTAAIRAWRLIA